MDDRLNRLRQLNGANTPIRTFISPYTPPKISPAAASTQPKQIPGAPAVTPVGQRYNNVAPQVKATWSQAEAPQTPIDKGLNFLGKAAGDIIHPFYQFGKMAAYTPKAIYREIQNKPITDVQQSVFGTNNEGDIARQIIGNTAQVALTAAVPEANIAGSRVAGEAALGAALGGSQALSENGSDVKKVAKGAAIGGALGGILAGATNLLPANRLARRVANESDPEVVKGLTGADDALSQYLASESDPKKIKEVIKEADRAGLLNKAPTPTSVPKTEDAQYANHVTTTNNLPSIIKDGEIKVNKPPVNGKVSPGEDLTAVFLQKGEKNDFLHIGEDNVKIVFKDKNIPKGTEVGGDQIAAGKNVRVNPSTVERIEVPNEQLAKTLEQQGYNVTVNKELSSATTSETVKAQQAARDLASGQPADTGNIVSTTEKAQAAAKEAAPEAAGTTTGDVGAATSPDVKTAVDSVMAKLDEAQAAADKTGQLYSQQKAQRAAGAASAADGKSGQEAYRAMLGQLKGEYKKGEYVGIAASSSPEEAGQLYNTLFDAAVADPRYANRQFDQVNIGTALSKVVLGEGGYPTNSDIRILKEAFGEDFGNKVLDSVEASMTGFQKAGKIAGEIAGAPRTMMASFDISGTLRQGGTLAPRYPKEFADAVKYQLKAFGSDAGFQEGANAIRASEFYDLAVKHNLANTAAEGVSHTEEQFVSHLMDKIPGIKASDRAYSMMLSKFRQNVWDSILTDAKSAGKEFTNKELDDIARVVNTFTGRGDLGSYLEKHSQTLTTALFSPRLWKSRLDMLNPVFYAKLSGPAREVAMQSAASFAATASTVLGLAAMAGATVETDPRSSDFGKIKVGNTRYDILGGLQQNLVFAWREISGEKKNSETGDVTSLTAGKFGSADRLSTLGDMVQNKENPLFATAQRIIKGKDRGGNPVNPITELANLAVPLPFSGTVQTINDVGSLKDPGAIVKGALMNSPDLVGISSQTYGQIPSKNKGAPNAQGQATYKGKIEPNMVTDDNGNVILDSKGKPVTVKYNKGASATEIKALKESKKTSALRDQYLRTLSTEDQALTKLSNDELTAYRDAGVIDQGKYDYVRQAQENLSGFGKPKIPAGAKSDAAKSFYEKYNSLPKEKQKEWLDAKPEKYSQEITDQLNQKLPQGLTKFNASNRVAKAYADYEKDINTHPDYSEIDKRNKAKSLYSFIAKDQRPAHVQDIYKEGGSNDLKYFIDQGAISKSDLDAAIQLDTELYQSGLSNGLKFSKKFRNTYGYGVPGRAGSTGGGSGGGGRSTNAHLAELLPSMSAGGSTSQAPNFSSRSRGIKLKSSNIPKSAGNSKKISIKL
jgi:hypothetical protein